MTFRLKISQDDNPESPADWGRDDLFLVANIRRYLEVAPPKGYSDDPDELREEGYLVFPVRGYVHSGVALALAGSKAASGYPFNCQFDSGWAGFVAVAKTALGNDPAWREQHHAGKTDEQILRVMAEGLITEWNQYLSGDVWGFEVIEVETCSLGHEHELSIDSCWGFYGREAAEEEGRAVLEHHHALEAQAAPAPTLGDPMYREVLDEALAETTGGE